MKRNATLSNLALWFAIALPLAKLAAQSPTPDAREAEIERLDKQAAEEKDNDRRSTLYQQSWELVQQRYRDNVPIFRAQWLKENDPEKKRELGEKLVGAAIRVDQPQVVLEVATGGKMDGKEIKLPDEDRAEPIPLHILQSFDPEPYPYQEKAAWVIRRMTRDRFELWLPHHGWLFDGEGKLINQAQPPRRDGVGRQWYGAFVPDGRWVTTDIWDYDRTLHFYSRDGKWRKDLPADKLVPRTPEDDRWNSSIIGWCRCDRDGRGFVLSVGTNGGRGEAWVSADGGQRRRLGKEENEWKICYPRDLEPKGMYTSLTTPNDRGDETLSYTVPGHGAECAYPTYHWSETSVQLAGPGAFGFWPGTSNVYIETAAAPEAPSPSNVESDSPNDAPEEGTPITLFYEAGGAFAGWIQATRISDTASRDGMLFHDELERIITLAPDYHVKKVERFVWADGTAAPPHTLYPDLRLGFFTSGKKLVLAKW